MTSAAASSSSSKSLRVLVLCGYGENAWMFEKRVSEVDIPDEILSPITKACPEVEFVFLDPPHILKPVDLINGLTRINRSQVQSPVDLNVLNQDAVLQDKMKPRAWWIPSADWKTYYGLEESITYIHEFLSRNQPFDGIMGFSSGGVMAAMICSMIDKPGLFPTFPYNPSIRQFRFMIACGAFVICSMSEMARVYQPLYPIPSRVNCLIVAGKNDCVVRPEESDLLYKNCLNSRMEYHPGGHFVPTKANWRSFFRAYITSFLQNGSQGKDVPGPLSYTPSAIALLAKIQAEKNELEDRNMISIQLTAEPKESIEMVKTNYVTASAKL